jgi:hypothetical protein
MTGVATLVASSLTTKAAPDPGSPVLQNITRDQFGYDGSECHLHVPFLAECIGMHRHVLSLYGEANREYSDSLHFRYAVPNRERDHLLDVPNLRSFFGHSSTVGSSIVTWNFRVNCSVLGANCRYTIHSPATEPLIAVPLESFQTFPRPALSGMVVEVA